MKEGFLFYVWFTDDSSWPAFEQKFFPHNPNHLQ